MTGQTDGQGRRRTSASWKTRADALTVRPFILSASNPGDAVADIVAEERLDPRFYPSAGALLDDLSWEAAAVVCDEGLLAEALLPDFQDWVHDQPPWSDLPFIVFGEDLGSDRRERLLEALGNVVFLPRSDEPRLRTALRSARHSFLKRCRLRSVLETQRADLAQSRTNIRTIFETAHQCQGLLAASGEIIYANGIALHGIGRRLSDVLGQPFHESPWFSATPGMPELVRSAINDVAAGQLVELRMALNLPSGRKHYDFTMRPLFDDRGLVVAMVPEAVDVTAQVQAQDGLRQAQKMEAIGQLTGSVAHDFNNLLTVIKSCSELLARPNLSDARRAQYVAAISETADRAAQLTAQLLAFARRQALQPKVFDVASSVVGVSRMMETLCGSQIELTVELPKEPCFADADPSQFDTALVNMVLNARDAIGGAGRLVMRVEVLDAIPPIRTHPRVNAPYVAVSVEDTGAGVAPELLDRIFEPFFTTKGLGEGTGLGLSQVFGFAKQSGGEVMVRSEPGEGSTFTLFLRRAEAPVIAEPELDLHELEAGHGSHVLVVEDNRAVGQFVSQTLTELGYQSHWVGTAQEALDAMAGSSQAYEILLTDVVMPGMDGLALAHQAQQLYPETPVVLTTGYSDVLLRDRHHGFELLQKPYSVEQLSTVLRRALARRRKDAQ